jgi:Flp pilus assembly protein TadG
MGFSSFINQLRRLRTDERGATAVMMGILMVPLAGFLGVGFEVSNWYLITRGMQNAADAATLAAAINNGPNYNVEAMAVAAQYGFVNGVNNITVAPTNNATCPSGATNCYSVSISGFTPLLVSQIVGYQGNGNINGSRQKQLNAVAVAQPATKPQDLCLLALASSGTTPALSTNGAPTGSMNGCDSMSNTAAQCNGHNLGLGISFAVGSNNGCGAQQMQNPAIKDPYFSQISGNIAKFQTPSFECPGGYPQESKHGNSYTVAATNQLSGPLNLSGTTYWCGDIELTANVTVTTPNSTTGAVIVIENGQLDLNGHVFQTANNSALTIVFTGSNSGGYTHGPADNTNGPGGALNITAPTQGPWAGMAIVQDPSLTTGVSVSAAGNSPTWDITGLIYMPHATITLKGAIDKSTFGNQCVVMVADNFQISGTGGVMKTDIGQCAAAGLNMPQATIPGGAKLVL